MGMRCATILATCWLFAAAISFAQDRALISGDVEDNQDTPISGVQITLRNDSLRIERTATSNSDGLYFFAEVVPAEGYVISATASGMSFAPRGVKFDVQVGETRHILPSLIAAKPPAPVSRLQCRGQSDLACQSPPVWGQFLNDSPTKPGRVNSPLVLRPNAGRRLAARLASTVRDGCLHIRNGRGNSNAYELGASSEPGPMLTLSTLAELTEVRR